MNKYKVRELPGSSNNKGRNKNSKNKSKKKSGKVLTAGRIVLLTFLSLIFVFFLAVNIFLYVYKPPIDDTPFFDIEGDLEFMAGIDEDGDEIPPGVDMSKDRNSDCYTFLILGLDGEGGGRFVGRTDNMMLAMFNVKENTISILNIPRDTYVGINYADTAIMNGVYPRGRINASKNGKRGDEASVDGIKYLCGVIKNTFGIPVNYYVMIDLDGFKLLVDKIGGVDFAVPLRMKYDDPYQNLHIDLQPGLQPLDGKKAEQVIRFRHGNIYANGSREPNYYDIGYPGEDIGRIQTQQRFIAAVLKKMLSKPDVNTIKGLFEVGSDYMLTNISLANAGWFAAKVTGVKIENIRTHAVPGNYIPSVNRYEAYKPETMEIINKYYNPYKKDIPETNFNIYDKDLLDFTGYKPEINIDGDAMNDLTK